MDTLERASEWSNILAVSFGLLAAFSAIAVVFFSGRLGKRKDAELARFQSEAGQSIAQAELRAASADQKAAQANERASALEVEAAQQQERAAKAERDLLELRQRMAARRLTDKQRSVLSEALGGSQAKGAVRVDCIAGDGESCSFAAEILSVLEGAGWPTGGRPNSSLFVPTTPIGLRLHVLSMARAPARAQALLNAFASAGLEIVPGENPQLDQDAVVLVVGNKPR